MNDDKTLADMISASVTTALDQYFGGMRRDLDSLTNRVKELERGANDALRQNCSPSFGSDGYLGRKSEGWDGHG